MGTEDLCEFRGTASPNNSTATVTFVMKALFVSYENSAA